MSDTLLERGCAAVEQIRPDLDPRSCIPFAPSPYQEVGDDGSFNGHTWLEVGGSIVDVFHDYDGPSGDGTTAPAYCRFPKLEQRDDALGSRVRRQEPMMPDRKTEKSETDSSVFCQSRGYGPEETENPFRGSVFWPSFGAFLHCGCGHTVTRMTHALSAAAAKKSTVYRSVFARYGPPWSVLNLTVYQIYLEKIRIDVKGLGGP